MYKSLHAYTKLFGNIKCFYIAIPGQPSPSKLKILYNYKKFPVHGKCFDQNKGNGRSRSEITEESPFSPKFITR